MIFSWNVLEKLTQRSFFIFNFIWEVVVVVHWCKKLKILSVTQSYFFGIPLDKTCQKVHPLQWDLTYFQFYKNSEIILRLLSLLSFDNQLLSTLLSSLFRAENQLVLFKNNSITNLLNLIQRFSDIFKRNNSSNFHSLNWFSNSFH